MKNTKLKLVFVALSICLFIGFIVIVDLFSRRDGRKILHEADPVEVEIPIVKLTQTIEPVITEEIKEIPVVTQKVIPKPPVIATATKIPKATTSPTITPVQILTVAPTAIPTFIPTQTPQPTTATLSEEQLESEMEAYLFQLINTSRSVNGKSALTRNGSIDGVARSWSEYQTSNESSFHNSNLGGDLIDAGVPFFGYGENIGYGVVTYPNNKQEFLNIVKVIHNGMMAEQPPYDGHKKTILGENVDYEYIGVGIEVEGKKFWLTTDYVM